MSNRQAPSRDIAIQFGKQEGFKHRVTSGWWKANNGDWVQAGPGIRRFVANNPEILENVGLSSETMDKPGTSCDHCCALKVKTDCAPVYLGAIKLTAYESKRRHHREHRRVLWKTTKASQAINFASFLHLQTQPLFPVQHLVARSSDRCKIGSWVIAHSPQYVRVCRVSATHKAYGGWAEFGEECLRANC